MTGAVDNSVGGAEWENSCLALGLGSAWGCCLPPMSGEDTRDNLSERANDLASSARESYEQGRDRIHRGVEQVKSTAGRAFNQMRTGTEATNG